MLQRSLPSLAVMFLVCLLFSGCEKKRKSPVKDAQLPPAVRSKESIANAARETGISEQEAIAYANKWANAISTGRSDQMALLVNWEKIIGRALDSLGVSKSKKKAILNAGALNVTTGLVQSIKSSFSDGSTYRLLRVAQRGNYHHAVFRVLGPEGGLNYHDLRLVKSNGSIRADQFFIAVTGEEMSDTFRKQFQPLVAKDKSILGRLSGEAKIALEDAEKLQKMVNAIQSSQLNYALQIYAKLTPAAKKSKLAMLYRIMATSPDQEQNYLKAIDEYVALFPNDASLGLLTLDVAAMRKDFDLLKRSRNQINAWTGGDHYVDLLVAAVFAQAGKKQESIKIAGKIDPKDLNISGAHEMKMTIAMLNDDFKEMLKQMKVLESAYGYEFGDLTQVPEYLGFTKSPEYQLWLKATKR